MPVRGKIFKECGADIVCAGHKFARLVPDRDRKCFVFLDDFQCVGNVSIREAMKEAAM